MKNILQRWILYLLSVVAIFTSTAAGAFQPRGQWLLEKLPAYPGGVYTETLYNTGTGLDQELPTKSKPEPRPTYSYMQLVRQTSLADFYRYCAKLDRLGWRQTFFNRIEKNVYAAYESGEKRVYFYYNGGSGVARVIDDCCNSASLDAFSADETEDDFAPAVYQFSYPYKDSLHSDPALFHGNGMLYVIRLSDGSLIVIDGGSLYQTSLANIDEFRAFLYRITDQKPGSRLRVALWYGTHLHGDHNAFFQKFMRLYHEEVTVERFAFNYQANEVLHTNAYVKRLRNHIAKFYPDAAYVKVRPGYRFQLRDADCQVLYCHEDFVDPADASRTADNANDASAVLRVTIRDKRFLFLGDAGLIAEDVLLKNFTKQTLNADVLQAAHHLYNDLHRLYPVVAPSYVFCPQSGRRAAEQPLDAYLTLRQLVPADRFCFADENIVYGFLPDHDIMTMEMIPVSCTAYDGSPLTEHGEQEPPENEDEPLS